MIEENYGDDGDDGDSGDDSYEESRDTDKSTKKPHSEA